MIARARLRHLMSSPQKTRLVVDQVRGRSVEEAVSILRYSPRSVARHVLKVVNSAVANAQVKDPNVDVDDLVIARATVDGATPMKRIRHRAMGRVFRIVKRSCHVTIDLDTREAVRERLAASRR